MRGVAVDSEPTTVFKLLRMIGPLALIVPLGLVAWSQGADDLPASAAINFEQQIAPVLIRNCIACHNASEPKGGLDLTDPRRMLEGGDSGPAIVAGEPQQSLLLERMKEGSMPPRGKGQRLAEEDVAALSAWVTAGAKWPEGRRLSPFELTTPHRAGYDWWSLQPVRLPAIPAVHDQAWVRSPIDAFILKELEQRQIAHAPEADRPTYIRRVTFDLLGLPPTPDEIDAFVNDASPDAFESLVDRLLASPHYGERWGRHWLDVVRFGESDGFENDKMRAESWRYRDYVIGSLNADIPYNQFVREQLAGDVLEPVTRESIAASGFLVAGPWDEVQNVAKSPTEKLRAHEEQMEELVAAVAQGFLGLTVNCSRCHDHKFDPIAQVDYYRLKAVFEGVDHGNRPLLTPDEQQAHDAIVQPIKARIAELKKSIDDLQAQIGVAVTDAVAPEGYIAGRFGETFNPLNTQLALRSKPVWNTPPLTIECWARVHSKSAFNILVANNLKESGDHWELYTYAGSGAFSFYIPGCQPPEIKSEVDITDGEWHYLAVTFVADRVGLFVDGKQVTDREVKRQRTGGPAGALYFAAYPPGGIGCDGAVDEVRVSNVVRPIEGIPIGPFAADETTIGLWHFDRSEAGRARDSSPAAAKPSAETPDTNEQLQARVQQLTGEFKRHEAELAKHTAPLVYAGVRKQPEPTVVFLRGDIRQPGEQVTPGALPAVKALPADFGLPVDAPEAQRRIRFADWVASDRNPLTARVLVNRVWQYHFGQGLVEMPSDFGFSGGRPSHPELLDWLAAEFMNAQSGVPAEPAGGGNGGAWSIKRLHRQILLSAVYRQSSRFNPQAAAFDADNRYLWRFSPHRLEAETVRDAMLAVSGELNPAVGGPSFQPFKVTALLTQFYELIDDGRPDFNRRTVYRINVNTAKSPFLDALDCPSPSLAAPRRRSTTTTLQALALMNDSFAQRQAQRLAERLQSAKSQGGGTVDEVRLAYRLTLGREPAVDEIEATKRLIAEHGLQSACWALLNASEFLYVR
ncbi:MAG: DUF1553 domain-containing protein [Planctomycetaceae bacterium]|nr:DUF1553 domain-containing protein [Planctomycetaceae bacterium]